MGWGWLTCGVGFIAEAIIEPHHFQVCRPLVDSCDHDPICRLVDEPNESTLFRNPSAKREDF